MNSREKTNPQSGPLTPEPIEVLLAHLGADPEGAGEEYCRLHENLRRYFNLHGDEDPAEAADQVLDRVAKHLKEGRAIANLVPYCIGVARFIIQERRRQATRKRAPLHSSLEVQITDEPVADNEKLQAMQKCLESLPDADFTLLNQYFEENPGNDLRIQRAQLAEQRGMSLGNLRIKVHRLRARLEKCLQQTLRKGYSNFY